MRIFRLISITFACMVLAVLVLAYAFLRSEGLSARRKPGNFEYAIANFAMGLSIPAEAKRRTNPLIPDSEVLAGAFTGSTRSSRSAHTEPDGRGAVLHH